MKKRPKKPLHTNALDPADPNNYPVDSRPELQQIAEEAHTQASLLQELLSVRDLSPAARQILSHVSGAHMLIMRLAAYMQSIEGKI